MNICEANLTVRGETLRQLMVYGSADSTGGDVTGLKRHQSRGRASLQRMLARLMPTASLCPGSEAGRDWGSPSSLCQEGTGHCTTLQASSPLSGLWPEEPKRIPSTFLVNIHYPAKSQVCSVTCTVILLCICCAVS